MADGAGAYRPADPCVLVVFGATGDLTKRKLMPALYNLASNGFLPPDFAVVGFAREELSHEEFRRQMAAGARQFGGGEIDPGLWAPIEQRLYYIGGDFADPAAYGRLRQLLEQVDGECRTAGGYVYYLATPPSVFDVIGDQLGAAGAARGEEPGWRPVLVGKTIWCG